MIYFWLFAPLFVQGSDDVQALICLNKFVSHIYVEPTVRLKYQTDNRELGALAYSHDGVVLVNMPFLANN